MCKMVVQTPTYLKAAEAFYREADRDEIVRIIATYPEAGDLMPGTGGYRKFRFARPWHRETRPRTCHLFVRR